MKLTLITVELASGEVIEDLRVTIQDRLKMERTGRVQKWDVGNPDSTHMTTQQVYLAWAASTRLGHYNGTFEQFRDTDLADLEFKQAEAVLGDPTLPAASAG
jgi:hypothetical protein